MRNRTRPACPCGPVLCAIGRAEPKASLPIWVMPPSHAKGFLARLPTYNRGRGRSRRRTEKVQWLIVGPTIFAVSLLGLGFYLAKQRLWNLQKMGSVPQAIATLIGAVVLIVGWIVSNNQSIERDILTKQRDQSSAIGEYVALARTLNSDDAQVYRRANQLAWQLFIWLPTDVYRGLGRGLANPADSKDLVDSLVAVRKSLLGADAGTLGPNDIIVHGPGIGIPKPKP
jgi:hypothetical protein